MDEWGAAAVKTREQLSIVEASATGDTEGRRNTEDGFSLLEENEEVFLRGGNGANEASEYGGLNRFSLHEGNEGNEEAEDGMRAAIHPVGPCRSFRRWKMNQTVGAPLFLVSSSP